MAPVIVYLGGPINGCADDECRDWRRAVKALLPGHEYRDPMDRDYRGKEADNAAAIVENDKRDIAACDIALMFCPRPSVGTSMEILYAWIQEKRVICVIPPGAPRSPWLLYHAHDVFPRMEDAIRAIRSLAQQ